MKLEYLPDGSDMCPLVRLYAFTMAEARSLHSSFCSLASGSLQSVQLSDILPVEAVDGCSITFIRGERDTGVMQRGERRFEVELSPAGWEQAAGRTESFREGALACYDWLIDEGDIQLLISPTGAW